MKIPPAIRMALLFSFDRAVRKSVVQRRRSSCYPQLEREKSSKGLLSASVISSIFTAIYLAKKHHLNVYNLSAILNGFFFLHFFAFFYGILATTQHLHFVRIKRRRSSIGQQVFVPYGVESDGAEPLTSVSALIGLRGSNIEKLVSSMIYLVIGNSLFAVSMNIIETDINFYTNIGVIISIFGLWLILTWGLEYSWRSDSLHYFGVCIALPFSLGGYMIQQNFSIFSLLLIFLTIVSLIAFGIVYLIKLEERYIHYQSLTLLLLESVALAATSLAGTLYIYNLRNE